jgi:hypothetical protein
MQQRRRNRNHAKEKKKKGMPRLMINYSQNRVRRQCANTSTPGNAMQSDYSFNECEIPSCHLSARFHFKDEREAQATYVEHQQDRDIQDARDLAEQTHATYVAHQQDREVAFEDERNRAEQAQAQQAAYVQHLQDREARLQRDPERDAQRAVRRDAVRAVTKRSAPSGSASKSKKGQLRHGLIVRGPSKVCSGKLYHDVFLFVRHLEIISSSAFATE